MVLKKIMLTVKNKKGQEFIIDKEDFEKVSLYNWYTNSEG